VENQISILSSNVRGIVNNWEAINKIDWSNYDFLAFNEIWAIKEFETLKVDGYDIKNVKTRQNSRGGGVIIFGKSSYVAHIVETPFIEGTFESVGIKVGNLVILNIYRPPSGNKEVFIDELGNLLDSLGRQDILLTGDFNINFLESDNRLKDICNQYGISEKIREVTRIASGTCLDNFITNLSGTFSVTNICIADHQAIKAKIKLAYKLKKLKISHTYRVMKEINWLMFKNGVHNMTPIGNTVEERWENTSAQIRQIVVDSFPMKTSKAEYKFSMSQGLLKSRDRKNKLLRDYKKGKIRKEVYINYNKLYRKLIQVEQDKNFKSKMQDAGNCGKKKWKVLKRELLIEKEHRKIVELTINGCKVADGQQIADNFKNHFKTCASKLADNLPPSQDTSYVMADGENWSFDTVSEADIVKIIKTLKNKNSCGPDLLSNRMLKAEKFAFARILKPLINESIVKGVFPDCLKTATVIPIFKKGNTDDLNNYRPISLLPVMSKVFEKVLNNQLTSIIENGFIDDNQFGFRKAHSTEDALVKFADMVQKELAASKHVVSVFVDVSKAFDSCDHGILITKIKKTGLDATGIRLISSYLKDRKQSIFVNGIDGGSFEINLGVGQGTILGPTFFKIYIMDLHLHTNLFTIKFADDSTFLGSGTSRDAVENLVNSELEKISAWFSSNRLTLHPNKSKFLVHSRDKLIDIKINNVHLQRSGYGLQEESVKLLGVEIDENLDWQRQIQAITKKIGKGNYILWRYKNKLSLAMKKVIYESFVRCHVLYGIIVWGGATNWHLKPLEKILSKIWSKIGRRKMHTLNRLKEHGILKLEDELHLQESKCLWKWDKNKIPNSLKNIVSERVDNLRGRRFNVSRLWKVGSISARLAARANKSITLIGSCATKKTLTKRVKKSINNNYTFICRQRNCFICGNNRQ
jgi:hypothetical protein